MIIPIKRYRILGPNCKIEAVVIQYGRFDSIDSILARRPRLSEFAPAFIYYKYLYEKFGGL